MDNITPQYLIEHCKTHDVQIERINLESGLLTLVKKFTPNSSDEYRDAESDTSIIYSVPNVKSQSSTWGTTGDGVGGYVGCKNGVMRINRSSCKKAWLKELSKLIQS